MSRVNAQPGHVSLLRRERCSVLTLSSRRAKCRHPRGRARRSPPEVSDVRDRPASELFHCNTPQVIGRHCDSGCSEKSDDPDAQLAFQRFFYRHVSAGWVFDRIVWRFVSGPCDTWLPSMSVEERRARACAHATGLCFFHGRQTVVDWQLYGGLGETRLVLTRE
ncbi:hypothetical protein VUR80DRAFT_68 [Thermomyces stellatus]